MGDRCDVYLYDSDNADGEPVLCCHWCKLTTYGDERQMRTEAEAVAHLREHEAAGHECGLRLRTPSTLDDVGDPFGYQPERWRLQTWDELIALVTGPHGMLAPEDDEEANG